MPTNTLLKVKKRKMDPYSATGCLQVWRAICLTKSSYLAPLRTTLSRSPTPGFVCSADAARTTGRRSLVDSYNRRRCMSPPVRRSARSPRFTKLGRGRWVFLLRGTMSWAVRSVKVKKTKNLRKKHEGWLHKPNIPKP